MNKFIFHGGVMSPRSESNRAFYREMVGNDVRPNILLVYFARELSEYDYLFERDRANFAWANPELKAEYFIASVETYKDDVADADIILFAGGDTEKLFEGIERTGIQNSDYIGKVIAGSSAGAYYMSEWYYTNSGKEVRKGSGMVPVAAWAHYKAERGNKYWLSDERINEIEIELWQKIGDGELLLLPEQQFITVNT